MQQHSELPWQRALNDAIEEDDPKQVRAKIEAAEAAITERIQGYARGRNPLEEEELEEALTTVRVLRARAGIPRSAITNA